MKPPCEVFVKRALPVIRSMLAKDLTERHQLSQTEIANRLGITQSAVSQYLGSVRGVGELKENLKEASLYSELEKISDEIAEGATRKAQIVNRYCEICDSMEEEGIFCTYHLESEPYLEEEKCLLYLKNESADPEAK